MSREYYQTQDAFELYIYYLALKRHFTSKYDFFKYNGKTRASTDSFEQRNDKGIFYTLSKRPNARDIILANMIANPEFWIGDTQADEVYTAWVKVRDSLTYTVKSDLSKLDPDFESNINTPDGQYPKLIKEYLANNITLETLAIIMDTYDLAKVWKKSVSDTIIFPLILRKIEKTLPFIQYDKAKFKQLLTSTFDK